MPTKYKFKQHHPLSFLANILHYLLAEIVSQFLNSQILLVSLELHDDRLTCKLQLLAAAFGEEWVVKGLLHAQALVGVEF